MQCTPIPAHATCMRSSSNLAHGNCLLAGLVLSTERMCIDAQLSEL